MQAICATAFHYAQKNVWKSLGVKVALGNVWRRHKRPKMLEECLGVTSCISDKKINNRIPVCENPNPKDLPNISDACGILRRAGFYQHPATGYLQRTASHSKSAPGLTQHPQQTLRVNRMHRRKIGFIEG
jgi:hypothetical protein